MILFSTLQFDEMNSLSKLKLKNKTVFCTKQIKCTNASASLNLEYAMKLNDFNK